MKGLPVAIALLVVLGGCATRATSAPDALSPAALAAMTDLAKTTAAPLSEITIVSETDTTWPDACLGCPGKGEMCAQVMTPGSRVVLLARGVTYEYHSDRSGNVRRCR
ncbi:MAG TPA: hypothetical protein VK392_02935 [Thermoanaerobaculia bacterium]|nr:hypothetical protein [Thermoanaerobaculia bacterium]